MMPRVTIAEGLEISRLIKGGWHLTGSHGAVDSEAAQRDLAAFIDAGITAISCSDIYIGVEELVGRFRRRYPQHARRLEVLTGLVPDLRDLERVGRADIEAGIDRSLQRLGLEQLQLVQYHWWDYSVPRYVEIALELERLRQAGKIAHVGVSNFDVPRLTELVNAGVKIATQQIQYSLLDRRPEAGMVEYCQAQGIAILAFGTIAGGFISERWLGQPEPVGELPNPSLTKYKLIIDDFGGWPLFQRLLITLRRIADKHGVDIASVATRSILDRPGVAAAIVGATNISHLEAHGRIATLQLDDEDRASLAAIERLSTGPGGDVYTLERDLEGAHGGIMRIMKQDLGRGP